MLEPVILMVPKWGFEDDREPMAYDEDEWVRPDVATETL